MATEVEVPASPSASLTPAFPRPTSLFIPLPDSSSPRHQPLLDHSSFSPYPTFPGSVRTADPYGLNAYLLHPDDSAWKYVDPEPSSSSSDARRSSADARPSSSSGSLGKRRSLVMLRKPSPLAQPPMSAQAGGEDTPRLQRRRSSSVGSASTLTADPLDPAAAGLVMTLVSDDPLPSIVEPPKTPGKNKKSFRRALGFTRKTDLTPPLPNLPPAIIASTDDLAAPPMFIDPSTPMSSRSNSNYSTMSSASSTSSSEGVKTPSESVQVALAGAKLADALIKAEAADKGKKLKIKGVKSWFGKKRLGDGSGADILPSMTTDASPIASTLELPSTVLGTALGPSPRIDSTLSSSSSRLVPDQPLPPQKTWLTEQLRRISSRKLAQLRAPSPHPLALHLKRQQANLPDEVAVSIQQGQRVFPLSVNCYTGGTGGLKPAQGGLWTGLAIQLVVSNLDNGRIPEGALSAGRRSMTGQIPHPKGVSEFLNRPTFEERNWVWYGNGTVGNISAARPGFGMWDLDFSAGLIGLAEVDNNDASSGPSRIENVDDGPKRDGIQEMEAVIGMLDLGGEATIALDDAEQEEAVAVPFSPQHPTVGPTISLPPSPSPSARPSPKLEAPHSSFRRVTTRRHAAWDSSESEAEEEDEEDEEDEQPLAHVQKRHSISQPRPALAMIQPAASVRARSQPASARLRQDSERDKAKVRAMEEVARARERREANRAGEGEKRAERSNRLSMVSSTHRLEGHHHHRRESSTSSSLRPQSATTTRQRTHSESPKRPQHAGPGDRARGRYHSFYDVRSSLVVVPPQQQMMVPMGMYPHPAAAANMGMFAPQWSMGYGAPIHPNGFAGMGGVGNGKGGGKGYGKMA